MCITFILVFIFYFISSNEIKWVLVTIRNPAVELKKLRKSTMYQNLNFFCQSVMFAVID